MSDWWDDESHVQQYMDMTAGYSGAVYLDHLYTILPGGSTILELGMGPGKDMDTLSLTYRVTGSDSSEVFLEKYRERHPESELLRLDAATMDFGEHPRRFDGIFSNKVLHHLSPEELRVSLIRQCGILNPGGILCHSFWAGEGEEEFDGLRFRYWNPESLKPLFPGDTETLELLSYAEEDDGDSLLVLLRLV